MSDGLPTAPAAPAKIGSSPWSLLAAACYAIFTFALVGGWIQHLYTCFTTNRWGFLIAGAMFFPVAIVHG